MKQRLVGMLVLGSLALILIPLLLDGEGVERPPLNATIPPAPVIDTTPLPEPIRPEILADSLETAAATPAPATPDLPVTPPAPEPAAETPQAQSISEPALAADGLPEAWALRLGVFGERANADGLLQRLQAAGHKAYIRPVGTLSGVFVGPILTRNEAVALQGELGTKFQISDVIVQRYDIAQ